MEDKELLEKIYEIIAGVLEINKDELNIKTNLVKDLGLESLDFVDIIVAFEKEFSFEIPDKDVKNLQTIEDIYNYIKENV